MKFNVILFYAFMWVSVTCYGFYAFTQAVDYKGQIIISLIIAFTSYMADKRFNQYRKGMK